MSEVKNEGLEVVRYLVVDPGDNCHICYVTNDIDHAIGCATNGLCVYLPASEAIAGYAVRDAQISSLLKAGEELDDLFTATSLEYGVELESRDTRIAELEKELSACATAVDNCELFRVRIAELEADLAYFPTTVNALAETVSELRAELAAIKWQEPGVLPETIILAWQGRCDGTVEGFRINGALVIPSDEGAAYLTEQQACEFFGLARLNAADHAEGGV